MPTGEVTLDRIDRGIVEALSRNARTQNKAIAEALGVSESLVALRLRRLKENRIAELAAQQDFVAAGLPLLGLLQIHVDRERALDIAHRIGAVEQVVSVVLVLAAHDLESVVSARDLKDLDRLAIEIGMIVGVEQVRVLPVIEVLKYLPNAAALGE
jgi:Lrp/AsnC family transcriptional regulator for asnA, asnC and gidA